MGGWERFVLGKGVGGGVCGGKGFSWGYMGFRGVKGFSCSFRFFLLVQLHRGVFIEV